MGVTLHQLALIAATCALVGAGWRVAGTATIAMLERLIAAMVIAATGAILWALGLGLVGLGSSSVALTAAAMLSWLTARLVIADPPTESRPRSLPLTGLAGQGALLGLAAACCVYFILHPGLDIDSVGYHLPEALAWVHSGHVGAVVQPAPSFQTGYYPLSNEALLAWILGISRGFAAVAAWQPLVLLLAAASLWRLLDQLGVAPLPRVLAAGAIIASPPFALELNSALNDDVAATWLMATAALAVGAGQDRPRLLALALLAGALAIGCKTTTAPYVVLVLVLAAVRLRRWEPWPLMVAAACGLGAGGFWYLRDLVDHGSPLWPEVSLPGGDRIPRLLSKMDVSFLQRPRATLQGRVSQYEQVIAGNLVLIGGSWVTAVLARRRAVALGGAVCAAGALLWGLAPFTGIPHMRALDLSLSTTRYLLPVATVGAVSLALATRGRGVVAWGSMLTLAGAFLWSLLESASRPAPSLPALPVAAAGVLVGAAVGLIIARPVLRHRLPALAAGLALAALAAVGLGAGSDGYVRRSAISQSTFGAPVIAWLSARHDFQAGSQPLAFAPQEIGLLAGDRLRHPIALLGPEATCGAVYRAARLGWVVVRFFDPRFFSLVGFFPAQGCLARARPIFVAGDFRVYRFP